MKEYKIIIILWSNNMAYNIPKKVLREMIEYYAMGGRKSDPIDNHRFVWGNYTTHFGFVYLSQKNIDEIVKYINGETVLEIGSGLGLWTYMLSLEGVKIIPTDNLSWWRIRSFYPFIKIEHLDNKEALKKYKTNVLLMIWPPQDDMAYETLKLFEGNKLIYIGERGEDGFVGCNGCHDFFELLKKEWKLIERINLKQFIGSYDFIHFYERK